MVKLAITLPFISISVDVVFFEDYVVDTSDIPGN